FLYQRHPCLATHQNYLVHFAMAQTCILQGNTARLDALLNQIFYQRLQLGTSQLDVQVLRTTGIRGNVRQIDIGLLATRQLHLGLLCSFFQTLHGQRVTFEVHARLFAELFYQEVNHPHIEVFTTQEGVTVGCQHFELHFAIDVGNLDNGNIEGTTTQVINGNLAVTAFLVQTIGQRCGSRLVDDPLHIKTRNASCIFGGLTLRVVEIGRNRDNRCCNGLAQVVFRRFLHFLENFSGNLGRCLFLAARLNPGITIVCLGDLVRHQVDIFLYHLLVKTTTDQALDRKQGVGRVGHRLTLSRLTYQNFTIFGEGHNGRSGASTFRVLNNPRLVAVQYLHAGVGQSL